jgi:hypothetical protein
MNNLLLFAVLVAYLPVASRDLPAQVMAPQTEKGVAKEYADEAAVVERDEVVYRYAADGTGVIQASPRRLNSPIPRI